MIWVAQTSEACLGSKQDCSGRAEMKSRMPFPTQASLVWDTRA